MDKNLFYKKFRELTFIYFIGLLAGCIFFHIMCHVKGFVFRNEWSMVFDAFMDWSIKDIYMKWQDYINWILLFHILICLLGFVGIGKIILEGMTVSSGFLMGSVETLLLLCFDIKEGFLLGTKFIIVIFIQSIILGGAVIAANSMSYLKKIVESKSRKWKQNQLKKYVILILFTVLAHMVYIFVCSYVNSIK